MASTQNPVFGAAGRFFKNKLDNKKAVISVGITRHLHIVAGAFFFGCAVLLSSTLLSGPGKYLKISTINILHLLTN